MNKTIINLQFLRAIAALSVVLFHTSAHYFAIGGETSGNLFSIFKQFGYAGVDVFFVISGYIIWVSTRKVNGFKGVLSYLYNRAARIYLGYWPYFLIILVVAYFYAPEFLKGVDYIGSFFLTQSYHNQLLLNVSWTLKYELYFYLCFAFLIMLPRKYTLKILIFAFFTIVIIQGYGYFVEKIYLPENFAKATTFYAFYFSPFCLEFLLGCFAGMYFEKRRIKSLLPLVILGVLVFILALYYQQYMIDGILASGYYTNQRVILFGTVSMILLLSIIELEKRGIVLLPKTSLLLGGASYSLYLSHTAILYFLYRFGFRDYLASLGSNQMVWMLLIVLLIVAYSIVHYLFIETPLMKLSKKFKAKVMA
ncbi:MAG: acyltransferase [Proteobacteria bacterium]|nr:acyltransferase [Pseudomonadota bacterium]